MSRPASAMTSPMRLTYCPQCGEPLTLRTVGSRERLICPACGYVHYRNPVPGVGVLIEMEGGVVLIKRGGHVKPGQWALPSGYIEADESVEEAAVREAREETGLEIQLEDLVGIYSFPEGPPTSGIIVFYRARPVGGALRAGDDAVDARVFQLDELPDMPFRTHRQAIQRWLALRQRAPYTSEERAVGFHIREAVEVAGARRIGHAEQQQAFRINAEFKKAGCRKLAEFEGGKILADPEQAFSRGHAGSEARGETGCRRFMAGPCENLMQYAALKSALQAEIGCGMAERKAD